MKPRTPGGRVPSPWAKSKPCKDGSYRTQTWLSLEPTFSGLTQWLVGSTTVLGVDDTVLFFQRLEAITTRISSAVGGRGRRAWLYVDQRHQRRPVHKCPCSLSGRVGKGTCLIHITGR